MRTDDLPFPRGETASTGLATVDSTVLANLEGKEYIVNDENPTSRQARTGRHVKLRVMRNKSGFALLPKQALAFDTTAGRIYSANALGKAATRAQQTAIVDEYLPAAGVADNDLFYAVVEGPSMCLTGVAADQTNVVNIGDNIVVLSGTTTGATTAGRVGPQLLRGHTTNVTFDIEAVAKDVAGKIGTSLSARTTANTNADLLVDVGKW